MENLLLSEKIQIYRSHHESLSTLFVRGKEGRKSFLAAILLEEESRELKVAPPTKDGRNERREEEVGKNHDPSGQKEVSR